MKPYSLDTHFCQLKHTLSYEGIPMIFYEINYPQFKSANSKDDLDYINAYYNEKAVLLETFTEKVLFPQAVEQYKESQKISVPFHPYELMQVFCVTYNQSYILSLYYDQYIFTGGAHGNTVRYSNTWNLKTDSILMLKDFFPFNPGYKADIITAINTYIAKEKAAGRSDYFDEYKQNVTDEFNENNFYITPEGIVVYFQQYQIAPYSSGIPQFLIPF